MTYLLRDIRDHLAGSTAITAEFSNAIYDDVLPQQAGKLKQYILISDVSNQPVEFLGGEAGSHETILQIDVWTDGEGGRGRANQLGELVRNRLSGYRGTFGTGCYGTAHMIRNNTTAADPVEGSSQHRRRVSMDFKITHSADVPTLT